MDRIICGNREIDDPRETEMVTPGTYVRDIKTAGELAEFLSQVPPETPIARTSEGYYRVIKVGCSVGYSSISSGSEESELRRNELPPGTVVVHFSH